MGETEKLKDFLFDTKKYGWEGLPDSVRQKGKPLVLLQKF